MDKPKETVPCSAECFLSAVPSGNSAAAIRYGPEHTGENRRFGGAKYAVASSSVASRAKQANDKHAAKLCCAVAWILRETDGLLLQSNTR